MSKTLSSSIFFKQLSKIYDSWELLEVLQDLKEKNKDSPYWWESKFSLGWYRANKAKSVTWIPIIMNKSKGGISNSSGIKIRLKSKNDESPKVRFAVKPYDEEKSNTDPITPGYREFKKALISVEFKDFSNCIELLYEIINGEYKRRLGKNATGEFKDIFSNKTIYVDIEEGDGFKKTKNSNDMFGNTSSKIKDPMFRKLKFTEEVDGRQVQTEKNLDVPIVGISFDTMDNASEKQIKAGMRVRVKVENEEKKCYETVDYDATNIHEFFTKYSRFSGYVNVNGICCSGGKAKMDLKFTNEVRIIPAAPTADETENGLDETVGDNSNGIEAGLD